MIIYKQGKDSFEPQKSAYSTPETTTKLSASETKILQYLIDNSGEIISRDKLLEIGWPDKVVVPNSLNVAIANLRKAFKTKNEIIITIKGAGFTIAKNTFIQHQIQPEVMVEADYIAEDTPSLASNNKDETTTNKPDTDNDNVVVITPLSKMAKFGYAACIVAVLAWIGLWTSSWQSPPCVSVNNQQICGNIELLNLNKLPKDLPAKGTVFIDSAGKLHEKN
ncbi:winged helix-turn-helix domain-containing protein [Photobacterium lucens]|uniref:winged helix-turn-helix domain-containing protein n=1 Tax=Photobacterium lucens TaxID=2562949 RepID=UPI00136D1472|nr:winged helix-turn-helix domain-containing protein [Photobacterium lucens]MBP2699039.1 helix-turn-helix domain-containing protein [Vibrio parahaemolyticus]MZG57538.1 helix-turn-helix domain-containing protein [Photobacterium lucens]MZG80890.1 helix-turn-helix domain-containing protein [Photobacterium lucens]